MRPHVNSPSMRRLALGTVGLAASAMVLSIAAQQLFIVDFKKDDVGVVENLAGASGVAVSPDGRFLMATGRRDDGLTSFAREMYFGSTTFDQDFVDDRHGVFGMMAPSAVTLAADGRHAYVTGSFDDSLVVFGYDASTDGWAFLAPQVKTHLIGGVFGLEGPSDVAVDPLSDKVFVTAKRSDSLAIFEQDATTDALTFITAKMNGYDATYLNGPSAVAVSPDNEHVYVASEISDSVTAFHNAPGFAQIGSWIDGVDGVQGLDGASGVAVSPDGAHVFATGFNDNALAVFARDAATGVLTFLASFVDGASGVDGLAGAADVVLNPAGDRVFVAGSLDNAVAMFRRDPATGVVRFLERKKPPVGLRGAGDLATSGDGFFVYTACSTDSSVTGMYVALCRGDELLGDTDGDAVCDDLDICFGDDLAGDSDLDAVCDDLDLCPGFDDAQESDGDGVPDGCDVCVGDDASGDSDSDQVCNDLDVCAGHDDTVDSDGDTVPDGCDPCAGDNASGDTDGDAVCDNLDVCRGDDATGDADGDGVCADLDCAPGDGTASEIDLCGVCGGDNGSCSIFIDGFESGNTSLWG